MRERSTVRWRGIETGALALTLAGAVSATGCSGPRIESFTATPRTVCPDTQAVVLRWSVQGDASLSGDPPVKGPGDVPSCGERTLPAADLLASGKATLTLTASKFLSDPARSQQVIARADDPQARPQPFGPDASDVTCDEARREVVAPLAFEPSEYDERIVVRRLQNLTDRPVTVSHRGRTWTLPAQQSVDLVPRAGGPPDRGVMTGGTWIVRAPLLDGERCGTPSARPALGIALQPDLGCTTGGAP